MCDKCGCDNPWLGCGDKPLCPICKSTDVEIIYGMGMLDCKSCNNRTIYNKEDNMKTKYTARVAKADVPNANNVVWPKHVLEEMIEKKDDVLPVYFGREVSASLDNIAAVINKIELKKDDVIVCIDVLDTPKGSIAKELINAGIALTLNMKTNEVATEYSIAEDRQKVRRAKIESFDIVEIKNNPPILTKLKKV